jgi:hypothetical protein
MVLGRLSITVSRLSVAGVRLGESVSTLRAGDSVTARVSTVAVMLAGARRAAVLAEAGNRRRLGGLDD